jgi:hypothetical protein
MVRKLILCLLFTTQILFSSLAQAQKKNPNVLFEGYSKILMGGVHVGYVVLRYEFDPKKKQFMATYLVKTGDLGGNVMESLKAVSDQELKPISYEYTSLVDKQQTKIIDAKFTKDKMTATIKQGKTQKKVIENVPKGAFLGIFLYYVILRSPSGLKTETRYDYKAVAEEDAKIFDGVATIGKEEKFNGIRAFKASNSFKDVKYSFYLTETGEALMSETPASNLKTILVAKPQEATANFKIPTAILNSLFGEVPMGITNTISKSLQASDSRTIIKGEPPKKDE